MIETERLRIHPLDYNQLELSTVDLPALEKQLDCVYEAEPIDGDFREIVRGQLPKIDADRANYIYHTFMLMIRKADNVVVGSCSYKNEPDEDGDVEIGYGLGEQHAGNGYMTEAVKGMCEWAGRQPSIKRVIAETERDNLPSQRVLERCGFKLYSSGENLWWELPL